MILKKCFEAHGIYAYASEERCEFALLFRAGEQGRPPEEAAIADLFPYWEGAPHADDELRRHRSLVFFPELLERKLESAAEFARFAVTQEYWDICCYWQGTDPQENVFFFPSGSDGVVSIRQWHGYIEGENERPKTLSDLAVALEGESTVGIAPYNGQWLLYRRREEISRIEKVYIDLLPGVARHAGAIGFAVEADRFGELPIEFDFRRVRMSGSSSFRVETVFNAKAFDRVELADDRDIHLALDPRDSRDWIRRPFSRIEFPPDAAIVTNFVSDKGLRAVFRATGDRARPFARMNFQIAGGRIRESEWKPNRVREGVFIPVGDFELAGFEGIDNSTMSSSEPQRILVGASPTEFVEVRIGDSVRFVPERAAALRLDEEDPTPPAETDVHRAQPPSADSVAELIHDGSSLLTTSWLTVIPTGGGATNFQPNFVTEPSVSPLFGQRAPNAVDGPDPLTRKYVALTKLQASDGAPESVFLPVIPWAGVDTILPGPDRMMARTPSEGEGVQLPYIRRLLARPTQIHETPDTNRATRVEVAEYGVTPQGLIAELDSDSNYSRLFLGDPDPNGNGNEFQILINSPVSLGEQRVFQDLQRGLRSEDLFLVVHKPSVDASTVFHPISDEISLSDFSFTLSLIGQKAPVMLLKYFRGRSLESLIADPTAWSCREHLVEGESSDPTKFDATSRIIAEKLAPLSADAGDKARAAWLNRVWKNPDWQGVVILDVDLSKPPPLFEVMQAGMKTESLFRFHHIGLDALPIKQSDLGGPPSRRGSAFALLHYREEDGAQEIVPVDVEPVDPAGGPSNTNNDSYRFKVLNVEVVVVNSEIAGFSAEVEVGFGRLFWDKTSGQASTRAITLVGSYESRREESGSDTNIFKLVSKPGQSRSVEFDNSWIDDFVISQAELSVTQVLPANEEAPREIQFFIGFTGEVNFDTTHQPLNELIKVNAIRLQRAGLHFTYIPKVSGHVAKKVMCKFRADGAQVDIDTSGARDSFLSAFPLKLKGFNFALPGVNLPDLKDLGYFPINFDQRTDFHFGFELELDLGALGKLVGLGDIQLPVLLGWRKNRGGFCCGIQFPHWNGTDFEIGFQQFLAIRADRATLKTCRNSQGRIKAFAIALSRARLVAFGKEMPESSQLDVAIFIPTTGQRKLAWIFGIQPGGDGWLKYIAAGHRVRAPGGNDAVSIVNNAKSYLHLEEGKDPCALIAQHDPNQDGWLVVGEFDFDGLVQAWLAIADNPGIYAMHLKVIGLIELGAAYRRVSDKLGIFAAEVNLRDTIPPLQFGAASVSLPSIRTEVHTDGGWLIDAGFPWNQDFRRSFQLEIAIFLGSGGFYFGVTSAAAADILTLTEPSYGYLPPDLDHPSVAGLRALRAGLAMRVGIGRSIDLGILKGEASITWYGSLEGAVAFKPDTLQLALYGLSGATGILVHIWAELDFVVLQARAELKAYVEVGFEIRKVIGKDGANNHYYLSLPSKLYAEVGIYLRFELWITIGCIRIKLFDLSFKATWRFETTIGGLGVEEAVGSRHRLAAPPTAGLPDRSKAVWAPSPPTLARDEPVMAIPIYAILLPCAAQPGDFDDTVSPSYRQCMVSQISLDIHHGFNFIIEFMLTWALEIEREDQPVELQVVLDKQAQLRASSAWSGENGDKILREVTRRFQPELELNPPDWPTDTSLVALPAWPGLSWSFKDQEPAPQAPIPLARGGLASDGHAAIGDPIDNSFIDFLRLTTMSSLDEFERSLHLNFPGEAPKWSEIWSQFAAK